VSLQNLPFLEVFMVNTLAFRWPKPLFFILGAHGFMIDIFIYIYNTVILACFLSKRLLSQWRWWSTPIGWLPEHELKFPHLREMLEIKVSIHHTHTIHVWYIYLHLVDFYGKCRKIYHTWMVWDMSHVPLKHHKWRWIRCLTQIRMISSCKR